MISQVGTGPEPSLSSWTRPRPINDLKFVQSCILNTHGSLYYIYIIYVQVGMAGQLLIDPWPGQRGPTNFRLIRGQPSFDWFELHFREWEFNWIFARQSTFDWFSAQQLRWFAADQFLIDLPITGFAALCYWRSSGWERKLLNWAIFDWLSVGQLLIGSRPASFWEMVKWYG